MVPTLLKTFPTPAPHPSSVAASTESLFSQALRAPRSPNPLPFPSSTGRGAGILPWPLLLQHMILTWSEKTIQMTRSIFASTMGTECFTAIDFRMYLRLLKPICKTDLCLDYCHLLKMRAPKFRWKAICRDKWIKSHVQYISFTQSTSDKVLTLGHR